MSKAKPQPAEPAEAVSREAERLSVLDEATESICEVWRAVLGLPKDFAITSHQIAICMTAGQLFIERAADARA